MQVMNKLRRHRRIPLALLAAALMLQAAALAACATPRLDSNRVVFDAVLGALVLCAPGAEIGSSNAPATGDGPLQHERSACWHCVLAGTFGFAVAQAAALLNLLRLPLNRRTPERAALGAWLFPLRLGGLGGRAPPLAV